jgi:hypothetical protein
MSDNTETSGGGGAKQIRFVNNYCAVHLTEYRLNKEI